MSTRALKTLSEQMTIGPPPPSVLDDAGWRQPLMRTTTHRRRVDTGASSFEGAEKTPTFGLGTDRLKMPKRLG